VRGVWPSERALGASLSAVDWAPGGQTLEESIALAGMLRDRGCDFVEVRAGQTVAGDHPRYDPYYLAHYSDCIRADAGIETLATGRIVTTDQISTLVGAGRAGLCLLLRTP
jgi:anthraniloyl-CoA monooxygenase